MFYYVFHCHMFAILSQMMSTLNKPPKNLHCKLTSSFMKYTNLSEKQKSTPLD